MKVTLSLEIRRATSTIFTAPAIGDSPEQILQSVIKMRKMEWEPVFRGNGRNDAFAVENLTG